jgi:hypothetical protein
MKLLSVNDDAKTVKGSRYGYLTGILYLAPAKLSGYEVCVSRSAGCTNACLGRAGRGAFESVQNARIAKTQRLFNDRAGFLTDLRRDIVALVAKAKRENLIPCVRLNGTSDLGWEGLARDIMREFADVQFYDYTKVLSRMLRYCDGRLPSNYHLTFSRSESNWSDCLTVLNAGGNVAAVFEVLPESFAGFRVVPGDESDLRFLDDRGVIVGLSAKGPAKRDESGFVVRVRELVEVTA